MKIAHIYTIYVLKDISSQIKNISVHGLFGAVAEFCLKNGLVLMGEIESRWRLLALSWCSRGIIRGEEVLLARVPSCP